MRKLPVFGVFRHAFRSVTDNFAFAWHVSWPWLAVLVPVSLGVESLLPSVDPEAKDAAAVAANARAFLGLLALGVASMFVFSSIAVNWHRYILKDEIPQGWARLRADEVVWRYFGNTLLVILIVIAATAPVVIIVSLVSGLLALNMDAAGALTMAIAGCFAIPLFYRLMLKLPAIAVGNAGVTLRAALEKSAGSSLALCVAGAVIMAAIFLVGFLLAGIAGLLGAGSGGVAYVVASVLQQLISWVVTIFTVTFLTSLYGFFIEGRDF
jgi:hypothetical protein